MSAPKKTRFIGPEAIESAIRHVVKVSAGGRVALVGGAAMQVYGSPRMTQDIDVVAESVPPKVKTYGPLTFGGEKLRAPNGVDVDVIVRDDDYADLYQEALENSIRVSGVDAPVVRPEYLAAMKMATGRHGKDDTDLEYLIGSGVVDVGWARVIINRHLGTYAAQEFDSTVEIVMWKKSTGKWP